VVEIARRRPFSAITEELSLVGHLRWIGRYGLARRARAFRAPLMKSATNVH
jgi:hypothetical protein